MFYNAECVSVFGRRIAWLREMPQAMENLRTQPEDAACDSRNHRHFHPAQKANPSVRQQKTAPVSTEAA